MSDKSPSVEPKRRVRTVKPRTDRSKRGKPTPDDAMAVMPVAAGPRAQKPKPAKPKPTESKPAKPKPAKSKPTKPRAMPQSDVRAFIQALAATNPSPTTELHFADPFTLLVAVVLSAQATDISVNRATETLFKKAATPEAMVALGVDCLLLRSPSVRMVS